MKIAIATIYYNSFEEINRLLDSIPKGAVDYFIGVDGPFKYIKEKVDSETVYTMPTYSTDGSTQSILEHWKYTNKFIPVIVEKGENATEFEKRNAYLETAEKLGDLDVL